MAKRKAQSNYVTRRVAGERTVNIYNFENGKSILVAGGVKLSGKINEADLAKQYNCKKVIAETISIKRITYGVPIDEYMKLATIINEEIIDISDTSDTADTSGISDTSDTADTDSE